MTKKKISLVFHYDKKNFATPAPVLKISLSSPAPQGEVIKTLALLDSGADITVIPQDIVYQLQLKYVNQRPIIGYDGIPRDVFVYSAKITFDNLGDFIIEVIASEIGYALVGRDILNKWLILLNGRKEIFEII